MPGLIVLPTALSTRIPQVTGMNHWIIIALVWAVMIRLILMIEKRDERAS